ncbi:hypothetical protein EDB81DRAFT_947639 [Dactylonectria macrodidyma]|uniref:Cholesterol oxidase n=1 Tax=Dactylonectria macrodidyma TaxID=307937 RepID=A0A9P9J4E5_9HYPO|nr:hypothetical protein EDB81DRAFT_947639 [Dactylonectria macrodidyma]
MDMNGNGHVSGRDSSGTDIEDEVNNQQTNGDTGVPPWRPPIRPSPDTPPPTTPRKEAYPRLSRPVELLRQSYDVVVIGSGYGDGVAASRMARGRRSVCVLEMGREKWPGEFPETLDDAIKEVHVSGELAPGDRRGKEGKLMDRGNPTGLYHIVVGDGQNAYVGNGLGGTSLLNANVFLEVTPKVLELDVWPQELRGSLEWKKYYNRARSVLEPVEYPESFPSLPKLDLLERQAALMGWEKSFYRVPQTTRFEDGPNSTGVFMHKSTLTGMDATGINDGSKTTTLVTYVADAWNWGAEIFCECEVRYVEKAKDREGWIVWFAWHGGKRTAFGDMMYEDLMWVHARECVFLGAGSLGSTEILLRSRQMGLDMSDDVGTEMSGNGDMLAFGYNTDFDANALGVPYPTPERATGPCITGVIDLRDTQNPLEGFVIEDASIPWAIAPFMFTAWEHLPGQIRGTSAGVYQTLVKATARLGSKFLGPLYQGGSVQKTAVYLVMSHDSSQGGLTLKKDKPVLRYSGVGRSDSVNRIHKFLQGATDAVGGTFVPNPTYSVLGQQQVTVHPIGGARMSKDGTGASGVVNHIGEVFTGHGEEVHEGLVVVDSAVIPAAVGVNPFATITALAERSVELVAKKKNIYIDYETKNRLLENFDQPQFPFDEDLTVKVIQDKITQASDNQSAGIGFTEIMAGYIHTGDDIDDFEIATRAAKGRCESARFFLSVRTWDVDNLVNSTLHSGVLTGTFCCPTLGGPFMVHRGRFQLMSQDPGRPDTLNFIYDFDMVAPSGKVLHFHGYKVVSTAVSFSPRMLWGATTTLYSTITDPDWNNKVVGRGTLYIYPKDFASEMKTLEPTAPTLFGRARSAVSFLSYFTKQASSLFFSPLSAMEYPSVRTSSFKPTPISQMTQVKASDGVASSLCMWNPKYKGNDDPAPTILFVPGASVDHQIFALPTIEKNAIQWFTEQGYRCYCVTHRVGRTVVAREGHTTYDARLDILAALNYIRSSKTEKTSELAPQKIYVIAHCAGSVALSSGLLDGTIPASWLAGITASNVFMNPRFAKVNYLKSILPIGADDIYEKAVGSWFDCSSGSGDGLTQRALNQLLRFYPVGDADEICKSVVCHRSSLVFGRLWSHPKLNAATHANLHHFLGGTTMRSLSHLMEMGQADTVLTNAPALVNLVTPENLARLQGVPILFFSGEKNTVYAPESTDISYTTLCKAHGRQWYEREVFNGRGHLDCWMGSDAYKDVYPRVGRHVQEVMGAVGGKKVKK